MNRVKKRVTILVMMIIISVFFCVISGEEVQAAPLLKDSPDVTTVDAAGNWFSGPQINFGETVPIMYNGTNIINDYTFQKPGGKELNFSDSVNSTTGYKSVSVSPGTIWRTKNVGYYKGKPITLALTSKSQLAATIVDTYLKPALTIGQYNPPVFEMWIEDYQGNRIIDDEVQFLLPIRLMGLGTSTNGEYVEFKWKNPSGISNFIVASNYPEYDYAQVDFTSDSVSFIRNKSMFNLDYYTSVLFKQTSEPLGFSYTRYNGVYPNGLEAYPNKLDGEHVNIFSKDMPIKLKLPQPMVVDTTNSDTFKAKLNVGQSIYVNKYIDGGYTDDLTINIQLPPVVDGKKGVDAIKITTALNKDITASVTKTFDEKTGQLSVLVPRLKLIELAIGPANNYINIVGEFDLDKTAKNMMQYDPQKTGTFTLPVTVDNSLNSTSAKATGTMQVKMPNPTATPVKKSVEQGSSTDELDPNTLVSDAKSILTDDTVKAIGFKENKTFDTLGLTTVTVIIESQETGVQSEIVVPVTVVTEVVEVVNLSWNSKNTTESKTKEVQKDKSDIENGLAVQLEWKTDTANRKYTIVTTDDQSGKVVVSNSVSNGTSVNTYKAETLTIPIDQLTVGDSTYTVTIYKQTDSGEVKGSPLDTLHLNLNLTGSLKLVSIPSDLSWTNRKVINSKGLLDRDAGNTVEVKVADTRNLTDTQKTWSVSAITQVAENKTVPFQLYWKDSDTAKENSLESKQMVLNNTTAKKSGDYYVGQWDEKTGPLLYSADYLKVGNYSNRVSVLWQLYDTPNPS